MEYSKEALKKNWGKPFFLTRKILFCLLLSWPILFAWNKLLNEHPPKVIGILFGIIASLSLFGAPLSIGMCIGATNKCKQHAVAISEGRLTASICVQGGFTGTPAGFIFEYRDYTVYRVRNYTESKRNFFVYGEIGCVHTYQGIKEPEVMVEKVKIPKVFTGEDMLREFLHAVREEV